MKYAKNLYKNELKNPFWTSIQLNRSGITGNKNRTTIDDTENTFGVSDRVTQQSTHSILMRPKLMEELAEENFRLGNTKAIFVKHRHLGRNAHDAVAPVKLPTGQFARNFIHLDIQGFNITEYGDLASTAKTAGHLRVTPPSSPVSSSQAPIDGSDPFAADSLPDAPLVDPTL